MGVSYEEWMGGVPKVGGSLGDLSYDSLQGNSSQGNGQDDSNPNMQGDGTALEKESQTPDFHENQKIDPKEEKGSEEKAKQAGERETEVEGNNKNRIPVGKEEIQQIENSSQEQSISGSKDRIQASNETSAESEKQKDLQTLPSSKHQSSHRWKVCNVSAGPDYIPCLDNIQAIRKLHLTGHFEHRERHCPDEAPTCLVRLPKGYKIPIKWPKSRDMIWLANAPHTKLIKYKRSQNWVKVDGEYLTFPGGGTQFKHGALHYIDFIQKVIVSVLLVLPLSCGIMMSNIHVCGRLLLERIVSCDLEATLYGRNSSLQKRCREMLPSGKVYPTADMHTQSAKQSIRAWNSMATHWAIKTGKPPTGGRDSEVNSK
ncbi:hypothetical protein Cgig2_004801 [Carnegiea gigantea]|uniref:Methyltransferase n=1 Tax=Carnegiea gigantea TaxID=171969 RepID=A0A9Q1QQE8_9CARY|nr:hypothetical protein Cgig2_004801 [Carnegiea gigantea]